MYRIVLLLEYLFNIYIQKLLILMDCIICYVVILRDAFYVTSRYEWLTKAKNLISRRA